MRPSKTPPPGFIAPTIRRGRYLFLDEDRPADTCLVCAGWEECGPDFIIDRPSFDLHAVELLATGSWHIRTGRGWMAAAAGTILKYGPSQPGSIRAVGPGPHVKYFADFRAPKPGRSPGAGRWRGPRHREVANAEPFITCYEQLVACADLPARHRARVADLLLAALLARLEAEPPTPHGAAGRVPEAFVRCRRHLLDHYPRVRGIAEAAGACHVSPEYFSRLFRRYSGQTAAQYLARLRVNHAAKLLQRSDLTVKAAGEAVGYEDPYHFSRVFKRVHGRSPKSFARRPPKP
ncbi:MAG: helix-turn-helix transcriptional regulator [Chthoniobacterales bacterium]